MKGQGAGLKARLDQQRRRRQHVKQNEGHHGGNHGQKRLDDFFMGVEASANIQRADFKRLSNRFRFGAEGAQNQKIPRFIINPENIHKIQWDLFMGSIIFYSLVAIPYTIGFQVKSNQAYDISEYIIDALFFIDLILNFCTAFVDPSNEKLVTDFRKIAMQYIKFWFWVDLVSTIPFESFFSSGSNGLKSVRLVRILRLARLFKLARFLKLGKLSVHLEKLDINPALMNVVKLVLQIFFIAHLISCFWFFLTTTTVTGVDQPNVGDANYPAFRTWATEFGFEQVPIVDQYVGAFYWTIATMLAVGYGDIHATNNIERIYSIFTMLCGGVMFGAVIAQVTRLIETRNPQARAFKEKMDEIKAYLGEKSLPLQLKKRAKDAYAYYLQRKSSFGETGVFDSLPRHLLIRLVKNIYEKEVQRINLFRTGDPSFVVDMVMNCRPFQGVRGEIIYREGDIAEDIIFLMRGLIKLSVHDGNHNVVVGYAKEKNFFGDFEFYKKSTRLCTAICCTNSNFLSMSNSTLDEIFENHFDAARDFLAVIKHRYESFQQVLAADKSNIESFKRSGGGDSSSGHRDFAKKVIQWIDGDISQPSDVTRGVDTYFAANDSLYRVVVNNPVFDQAKYNALLLAEANESSFDGKRNSRRNSKRTFLKDSSDENAPSEVVLAPEILVEETMEQIGKRFILHPRGTLKIYWDSFVGAFILYSVLLIPVQIGFAVDDNPIFEHVVDSLFFLDIILSVRTAYYSEDEDAWILVPKRIFMNYLKSWFLIDFCSSIPFDSIIEAAFQSSVHGLSSIKLLKTFRLARLLKLARLMKLSRYINQLEDILGVSPSAFDLLKMIMEVVFIGHIIACCWWGLSSLMTQHTWYDEVSMVYKDLDTAPLADRYLTSLYWTFTTLATVGYGDITPVNTSERLVNIFIMILGATVFGYIVANVSSLMGTLNQTEVKINEKISEVTEYLNEKNCPKLLAGGIIRHFRHLFNQTSVFDEEGILLRLPRSVSNEIQLLMNAEKLRKIALFRHINNSSVSLFLFKLMHSEYFDTNQYIIRDNELANEIRFIVSGRAAVYVQSGLASGKPRRKKSFATLGLAPGISSRRLLDRKKETSKESQSNRSSNSSNKQKQSQKVASTELFVKSNIDDSNNDNQNTNTSKRNKRNIPSDLELTDIDSNNHVNNNREHRKDNTVKSQSKSASTPTSPSRRRNRRQGSQASASSSSSDSSSSSESSDSSSSDHSDSEEKPLTKSHSKSAMNKAEDSKVDQSGEESGRRHSLTQTSKDSDKPAGPRRNSFTLPTFKILSRKKEDKSKEEKKAPKDIEESTDEDEEDYKKVGRRRVKKTTQESIDVVNARMTRRGYIKISELTSGDFLGHVALLQQGRHSAAVRAIEPCAVYSLRRTTIFNVILKEYPSVALLLQQALGEAVFAQNQELARIYVRKTRADFLRSSKEQYTFKKNSGNAASEGKSESRGLIKSFGNSIRITSNKPDSSRTVKLRSKPTQNTSAFVANITNKARKAIGLRPNATSKVIPAEGHVLGQGTLRPDSKWHIVRQAIKDARVTATVAKMQENRRNDLMKESSKPGTVKDNGMSAKSTKSSTSSKRPTKADINASTRSTSVFMRAMQARIGKPMDNILTEEMMNYDTDDEVEVSDESEHERHEIEKGLRLTVRKSEKEGFGSKSNKSNASGKRTGQYSTGYLASSLSDSISSLKNSLKISTKLDTIINSNQVNETHSEDLFMIKKRSKIERHRSCSDLYLAYVNDPESRGLYREEFQTHVNTMNSRHHHHHRHQQHHQHQANNANVLSNGKPNETQEIATRPRRQSYPSLEIKDWKKKRNEIVWV